MRRAFTLIELLVVVAIVGLLLGILLPGLTRAREQSRKLRCAENLYQIGLAIYNYCTEWKGRVPYVLSPMTNGTGCSPGSTPGFGRSCWPDEQLDPFDRSRWPLSLPNVLMPVHMGQEPRVFVCPAALTGWPRSSEPLRYTYREAAANQPNGQVRPAGSYEREAFGFLDGRELRKLQVDWHVDPRRPEHHIENAQNLSKLRGTFLRDLILRDGPRVIGPHDGGIIVLDRDLQVKFRSQKTAQEDLAPDGLGGAAF